VRQLQAEQSIYTDDSRINPVYRDVENDRTRYRAEDGHRDPLDRNETHTRANPLVHTRLRDGKDRQIRRGGAPCRRSFAEPLEDEESFGPLGRCSTSVRHFLSLQHANHGGSSMGFASEARLSPQTNQGRSLMAPENRGDPGNAARNEATPALDDTWSVPRGGSAAWITQSTMEVSKQGIREP
jgi:hypothetical protein